MKMGRGSIERIIHSWLTCRVDMSQKSMIYIPATRFCRNASGGGSGLPANSTNKPFQVRIGDKKYVVKTNSSPARRKMLKTTGSDLKDTESEVEFLFTKPKGQRKIKRIPDSFTPTLVTKSRALDASILGNSNNRDQEPAVPSEPEPPLSGAASPSHTTEGLELGSILKHPLYHKHAVKPFLLESSPTFTLEGPYISDYPFHVASAKDITRATASPITSRNLALWKERHLQKLGIDAFSEYQYDLQQDGVDFKRLIEEYLKNGDDTLSAVSPVMEALWESVQPVLKDLKNPQCFNKTVIHPNLRYFSKIRFVATYNSKPMLISFKKTAVQRKSLHFALDDPIQHVAKLGALNFDKAWPYQIKECLVVYAYSDGSPADIHVIASKEAAVYWKIWLRKLEQFWKTFDLSTVKYEKYKMTGVTETGRESSTHAEKVFCKSSAGEIPLVTSEAELAQEKSTQTCEITSVEADMQKAKIVDVKPEDTVRKLPNEEQINVHQAKEDSNPKEKVGLLKVLWNFWKS